MTKTCYFSTVLTLVNKGLRAVIFTADIKVVAICVLESQGTFNLGQMCQNRARQNLKASLRHQLVLCFLIEHAIRQSECALHGNFLLFSIKWFIIIQLFKNVISGIFFVFHTYYVNYRWLLGSKISVAPKKDSGGAIDAHVKQNIAKLKCQSRSRQKNENKTEMFSVSLNDDFILILSILLPNLLHFHGDINVALI